MGRGTRRRARMLTVALAGPLIVAAMWHSAAPVTAQEAPPSPTDSPSPTAEPTTSPSPSVEPSPTDAPSPSGPSPTIVGTPTPGGPSWPGRPPAPRVRPGRPGGVGGLLTGADGSRRHRHRSWKGWAPDARWGTYGTETLDRAAAAARRRGWSRRRIDRAIYAPFLVQGPATWSDSWDAPRSAGGHHPHHGQDVLCRYGAPVLAVDAGVIRFGSDALGGREVTLIRSDGSSWYYAHLSAYAPGLADGDRVGLGRMIGRCGASGDATVPHVHFTYLTAAGRAVDPMPALVAWLRVAERWLPGHRADEAKAPGAPRGAWPAPSLDRMLGSSSEAGGLIPPATPAGAPPQGGIAVAAAMLLVLGALLQRRPGRRAGSTAPARPATRPPP